MSRIGATLYNVLFKRTSTFVLTVMVGTIFFERTYDIVADTIFDTINQGRLWKHIKDKYETK